MTLLKDLDEFDRLAQVGDWAFVHVNSPDNIHIAIMLHEGMGGTVILPVTPQEGKVHWEWDGDREAPTLTPSILVWGNGMDKPATWHGFLRAGKLVLA